ncbi:MAG: hypothetical protein LBM70_02970 [Victivallales bacterium]|nr:hypothetical protein [Victivallales bacterium]
MKYRLGITLIALFLTVVGFAEQFGDVTIENVAPMVGRNGIWTGYFIREFRIENNGAKPTQIWMRLSENINRTHSVEHSLLLPPGGVRNVQLYWPPTHNNFIFYNEIGLELAINGKHVENNLILPGERFNISSSKTVLGSESVPLHSYWAFCNSGSTLSSHDLAVVSPIPVAQWGIHTRDYAGLKAILISSSDKLPSEVDAAIKKWMFGGGTLVICVPPDAPWPANEKPEPPRGEVLETQYGWGRIVICRPIPRGYSVERDKKSVKNRVMPNYPSTPGLMLLQSLFIDNNSVNSFDRNIAAKLKFKIPTVPLHSLFYVMLIFAIIVGPVNYFTLRRFRRESWLFVTTPAISLIFCLALIAFITIHEGWYSRGKAHGITLLDEGIGLTATLSRVIVYAPIPPLTKFHFDSNVLLQFLSVRDMHLNIDDGQSFSRDLLQPRIPLSYQIERVESRREQLKIEAVNGEISIVNGLGVTLSRVVLADANGKIYQLDNPIPAGGRTTLKPTKFRTELTRIKWGDQLKDLPDTDTPDEQLLQKIRGSLVPGYYVAIANEPVFYALGFRPDRFAARHLIFGKIPRKIWEQNSHGN